MMTIEGMAKYLDDSGISERLKDLKPGDSFGVEIPVNEDKGKFIRFWIEMTQKDDTNFVTLDFDGMITVTVCTDEKKLTNWFNNSGFMELAELAELIPDDPKKEEEA